MKKLNSIFKSSILSLLCLIFCMCISGCLTTAEYEAIYNDDAKIASSSSNVRIASVQTDVGNKYSFSCSSFSGVYHMKNINSGSDVDLSLTVKAGKFKVVAVNDKSVYTLAEGDFEGKLDFTDIPDGIYTLKAVGVEAEFSLKLTY